MPLECVAIRCAAQNHTVSGNLDRCIAVAAVIDVWRPSSRHSWVCARLFNNAARVPPQAGKTTPCGKRRSNKNDAQLVSAGLTNLGQLEFNPPWSPRLRRDADRITVAHH